MAFSSVILRPGVVVEATPTLNTAGYSASSLGRYRAGLFEKLGGWLSYYLLTIGIPRALLAWQDFSGTKRLATAATTAINVITGNTLATRTAQNITPQTLITDFAPNFTTTINTTTVTVDDSNIANVTTLDSIEFLTPISVGGIILSGVYPITLVVSTTQYRIEAATAATSSVASGGSVPSFTTTNGSSTVSVTFTAHGLSVGNTIVFPISTSVGGITVLGAYTVIGVAGVNVFSISVSANATSGATVAMNGSEAELKYYIAIGPASANGTGWGVGGWGVVPWGGTGTPPASQTGTPITATDYTLALWGETLLANPANGGIFKWGPASGYQNMQLIAAAPLYASAILIATPAQILFALGCAVQETVGLRQDPLSYAWCDQADYDYWIAGGVNPSTGLASQAGSNRIPTGSAIKAGLAAGQQVLLWTDLDVWTINYTGSYPIVFTQEQRGTNCGTISRHSVAQMAGIVYWWSQRNFYRMAGGAPEVIPCSVWDVVFQDLDTDNLDKCWIETVTSFNEVWFFYPSASGATGQCDKYAKVNVLEAPIWDYGSLPRAAGIDQSVLGNPIMATPGGTVYQHETGYNADGQPLQPSFTTGYFMLGEGEDFVAVDQFYPDFKWGLFNGVQTATVLVTFNVINFTGDTPRTYGPYSMTNTTEKLDVRFRGRQVSFTMTSDDQDTFWRIGRCRFRFGADGRQG